MEIDKEEFDKIMAEFNKDYVEPKYYNNGKLIEVTGKDKDGITWVAIMPTKAFQDAMVKEAGKLKE